MVTRLIHRETELAFLERSAKTPKGELILVWGRRRVGKTFLLEAFAKKYKSIFYTATQQSQPIELEAFTQTVRASLPNHGLPNDYVFSSWGAALEFIAQKASSEAIILVLDEFSYLSDSTPGIESIIQRFWDKIGKKSYIKLILCSSAISYMTSIVGIEAPLHQRSTLNLHVTPFDYIGAGLFVENLPPVQRAIVYGILGGTALYLEQWDVKESLENNLIRLFGSPVSPLVDAAELVLSGELRQIQGAFRILEAISHGKSKANEIADFSQVAIERPLKKLIDLGFIERRVPVFDDPLRSKRSIYRILDPYFVFWFRFIASSRDQILRGLGEKLVKNMIMPNLDNHMGLIFEEMAREHARYLSAIGQLDASLVGSYWSTDGKHKIDIVGLKKKGLLSFVGTVKWSSKPIGDDILANLNYHASSLDGISPDIVRLIYSRAGCEKNIVNKPNLLCFSIDNMYLRS